MWKSQVNLLVHKHSMKNGLETWQSQRTSPLSSIITWKYADLAKMTVHGYFDWLKWS